MYRDSLFKRLSRGYIIAIVVPTLLATAAISIVAYQASVEATINNNINKIKIVTSNLTNLVKSTEISTANLAKDESITKFIEAGLASENISDEILSNVEKTMSSYLLHNSDRVMSIYMASNLWNAEMSSHFFQPLSLLRQDVRSSFAETNIDGFWLAHQAPVTYDDNLNQISYIKRLETKGAAIAYFVVNIDATAFADYISNTLPLSGTKIVMRSPLSDPLESDSLFTSSTLYTGSNNFSTRSGNFKANGFAFYYDFIPNLNATIVYNEPYEINVDSLPLYVFMMTIVLVGVAGLILRTAIMTRDVKRRIDQIVHAMKRVEIGNLSRAIPPDSNNDEISYLKESFNSLQGRLDDTLQSLSKREREAVLTQLIALQNQINPHFIYNTIEIFRMQMEIANVSDASEAIASFGNMLRYNMDINNKYSRLYDEVEHASNYIRIMNLRYENAIDYNCNLPKSAEGVVLIKFLLQPIVENSIKYNRNILNESILKISINISMFDKIIRVDITDNGVGIESTNLERIKEKLTNIKSGELSYGRKDENHVGLGNIARRLSISYGKNATMTIESKENEFTTVSLVLPIERKE